MKRIIDSVPMNPTLVKFQDAKTRIENMFNSEELHEEGMHVEDMLAHMTEEEVMRAIEEQGIEPAIPYREIQKLIIEEEWKEIVQLPANRSDFFDTQFGFFNGRSE